MINVQSKVTISYNVELMFADKITLMEHTKRRFYMEIFPFLIKVDILFDFALPN